MTPAMRDRKIAALRDAIAVFEAMPVVTPCAECEWFAADSGRCGRWNTIVPEANRADGCPQWQEGVPF